MRITAFALTPFCFALTQLSTVVYIEENTRRKNPFTIFLKKYA